MVVIHHEKRWALRTPRNQSLARRAGRMFGRHFRTVGLFFRLLPLVVMPLDSEEHTGAENGHLEGNEDYRDPIHFEIFLAVDWHYLP